ncbi:MAG: class I SAM-dependent methyltransferase [Ignavibacteriales bacterium]|jgi:SAM-dependent methyltransferase|nr:class I SAM-dependent methyltransferase [Ignavibacteriaceae bacterium]NLH61850.1 class I SAM-dependent methyltransferase [Ignavibacteriales bacterium]HOJ17945.1 class I SAM-dependent methyltransferase [Ignavibacteriaceae bacterium]HPO54948.1 class I SAM-dependent methyltransferase [Ignavibacteriaceae bacterium]
MQEPKIKLPGLEKQYKMLLKHTQNFQGSSLFIGYGLEELVRINASSPGVGTVWYAVENEEALLWSRILLGDIPNVKIRNMEFDSLDLKDSSVSLVYSQGAISKKKRGKILKDIKRVLTPDGLLSVGEVTSLRENVPAFVKDIWDRTGIVPLDADKVASYYNERNFQIVDEEDLSSTLKNYYTYYQRSLNTRKQDDEEEKNRQFRKLFGQIKHEVHAYLKLGGDKYIGFKALLLKRSP